VSYRNKALRVSWQFTGIRRDPCAERHGQPQEARPTGPAAGLREATIGMAPGDPGGAPASGNRPAGG
jgi:hypothetical protein